MFQSLKATNKWQDNGTDILHLVAQHPINQIYLYTRCPCPSTPTQDLEGQGTGCKFVNKIQQGGPSHQALQRGCKGLWKEFHALFQPGLGCQRRLQAKDWFSRQMQRPSFYKTMDSAICHPGGSQASHWCRTFHRVPPLIFQKAGAWELIISL